MNEEEGLWFPYIKPTDNIHESGYRTFEVGYIYEDEKTKVIIGESTDHIYFDQILSNIPRFNVDLLHNGCIRFHNTNIGLKWDANLPISSMRIIKGFPNLEGIK